MKTGKGNEKLAQGRLFEKEELAEASMLAEAFFGKAGIIRPELREVPHPLSILNAHIYDGNGSVIWHGDLEDQQATKGLIALSAKVGALYVHFGKSENCRDERLSPYDVRKYAAISVEKGTLKHSNMFFDRMYAIQRQLVLRERNSRESGEKRMVA